MIGQLVHLIATHLSPLTVTGLLALPTLVASSIIINHHFR